MRTTSNSILLFLITSFLTVSAIGQNNLRLLSATGEPIKVSLNKRIINQTPEAEVLIENVLGDTVQIGIEFENKQQYNKVIYLVNQGKHDSHKEHGYFVLHKGTELRIDFSGISEIIELPKNIVPKKPQADSSLLGNKKTIAHLYEMKNNQIEFFNNLPSKGHCTAAMPEIYLGYFTQLMKKNEKLDERLYLAQELCKNNCINVQQLKTILSFMDAEFDKLVVAKLAYFNLVDTTGKIELVNAFKYEGAIKDLRHFLSNAKDYQSIYAINCTQVTEESFMSSFIKKQMDAGNDSYRIDLLKKNYFNFCFSVNQISRILDSYTHDREKLQACKLLYFKCAEKKNYLDLNNAFAYPQCTKQLEEFVKMQER
ncbi:MAG: DUF4476 domain-containing protein [Bacteroidota bacterium]